MDLMPAAAAPMSLPMDAHVDRWPWRRAAQALAAAGAAMRVPPPAGQAYEYRGCSFVCMADELASGLFAPRVLYQADAGPSAGIAIALDAVPCTSAEEALRLAEREAARWVDRHQILPPLRH
ncbi:MAG: hypothetical protein REJ24_07450 [Rhodocyclaceae bacterium]|nr:hypothetical protein [Pseudomonadota bacterium]MDQ7972386.1 hypothetical protein [Rhodocyclaceae bacterium]MDQ8001911.1 hypothetical protein [Pseudomonadota bacterium]MDQ8018985.1 hypothetical protein [Pseudomonadota bacterium]